MMGVMWSAPSKPVMCDMLLPSVRVAWQTGKIRPRCDRTFPKWLYTSHCLAWQTCVTDLRDRLASQTCVTDWHCSVMRQVLFCPLLSMNFVYVYMFFHRWILLSLMWAHSGWEPGFSQYDQEAANQNSRRNKAHRRWSRTETKERQSDRKLDKGRVLHPSCRLSRVTTQDCATPRDCMTTQMSDTAINEQFFLIFKVSFQSKKIKRY